MPLKRSEPLGLPCRSCVRYAPSPVRQTHLDRAGAQFCPSPFPLLFSSGPHTSQVAGCIPAPSQIAANRTDPPSEPAPCRLDAASVKAACEGSLRRLQTSYIDLYQVRLRAGRLRLRLAGWSPIIRKQPRPDSNEVANIKKFLKINCKHPGVSKHFKQASTNVQKVTTSSPQASRVRHC